MKLQLEVAMTHWSNPEVRIGQKYVGQVQDQCQAINVGFEFCIGIESKLSISIIGFDLELGEFCHDFHSISIPINHSGSHFNLPAISTSLK